MAYIRPKNSNRVFARNSDGITPNDNLTSGVDNRTQFFGSSRGSVKVNVGTNNTTTAFDSAQDAWHAETFQSFVVPTIIDRDSSFSGNNLMRNFRNDQYINVGSDSGARYKDTMWTFGGGVRIYSDGTTPSINFVDSDYFRGGADASTLMIQGAVSTHDSIGLNLASAPDSDFLNYQEDSFYSAPRDIISNSRNDLLTNLMSFNAFGFIDRNTIRTAFEGGVPFEYDSTPIFTSGGAGGGGGGPVVAADPESWS